MKVKLTYHLVWILLPVALALVAFVLSFNGLYGQDGFGYLQYAEAWEEFFLTGNLPNPGHITWPPLYAVFGAILHLLTQLETFTIYLLSSYVFYGLSCYQLFKVLSFQSSLTERQRFIYLLLAFALSPYIIRQVTLVASDFFAIWLIICTYWYLIQWKKGKKAALLLLFTCASAAVFTRYGSFFVVLFPCLYSGIGALKRKQFLSLFISVGLGLLFLIPLLMMKMGTEMVFLEHSFLTQWNFSNAFEHSFSMMEGSVHRFKFPNIIFVLYLFFHPGFAVFGSLLLLFFKSFKWSNWLHQISILSIVFYLLFLAGTPFQNPRYLLLAFPIVIIIYEPLYAQFLSLLEKFSFSKIKTGLVAVSIITSIALTLFSFRVIYDLNQFERETATELNELRPSTLYSFGLEVSLSYYCPKHTFISYYEPRTPHYKSGDLILANNNWKEKRAVVKWQKAKKEERLEKKKEFSSGWSLYEVK